MEGLLVLEVRHLHVDACVDVTVAVRPQHVAVGRELDARNRLVAVELASGALRADSAGEKADFHSAPCLGLARHVAAVGTRPEVYAQHPHRGVRIVELVAALRREAYAADHVEPPALYVREALVVVAVHVVDVPVLVPDDGLEPHL